MSYKLKTLNPSPKKRGPDFLDCKPTLYTYPHIQNNFDRFILKPYFIGLSQ